MFYIIKRTDVDDIEVLGVYSTLDKAKKYLVKTANKHAEGDFVSGSSHGRMYQYCTIGIEVNPF